jgi:hypothetical protein
MPAKTTDPTAVFTEAILAGVKQTQELAFSGLTLWVDFAGKAFSMPELDGLPFVEQLPNPKTVIESSFGFAEDLLGTKKDFAIKVVEVVTPKKSA